MPGLSQRRHQVETDEPGAARDGHHPGVRHCAPLACSLHRFLLVPRDDRAHPPHGFLNLVERRQQRHADVALAVVAEHRAGEHHDSRVPQQTQAELGRALAGRGDVDVDVERAVRSHVGQPHRIQGVHQERAPLGVDVAHLGDALLGAVQRRQRGGLRHGRGADGERVLDLDDRAHKIGRSRQVADAPPRHRVALGEAIDDQGALAHPRFAGDADVARVVVDEAVVDLVRDHQQVVLAARCAPPRRSPPAWPRRPSDCPVRRSRSLSSAA